MTSLLTNTAANTALRVLTETNKNLETTENRISTGKRVASASDNAAYWSIATTMQSDYSSLSSVKDALGLGASSVDTAYTALDQAKDTISQIKDKLVTAKDTSVDRAKIQSEIQALQDQLRQTADSATFSGTNLLSQDSSVTGYNATTSIVSSFSRANGVVTIGTIDVDTSTVKLYDAGTAATAVGILDANRTTTGAVDYTATSGVFSVATLDISALTDSSTDLATLDAYIKGVDAALNEITTAATTLGSTSSRIEMQKEFVSSLMDTIEEGIGTLIDADMNEESTRLKALQTQQELGIQALSIANSSAESILSLFR